MDTFKTKTQKALDDEIARLISELNLLRPTDDEYAVISGQLKLLMEAREKKDPSAISMETILTIGANLVAILVVLNFERTGVITSKAFSFLRIGRN